MTSLARIRFAVGSLGLLALAGSITLNIVLGKLADQYYREGLEVRLDPLNLGKFPPSVTRSVTDRPLAVIFGDSRAAQWPMPSIPGYETLNLGASNETTVQQLGRFDTLMPGLHPKLVIIETGINDLKAIPVLAPRSDITQSTIDNIRQLVQKSRDLDAEVVLATIFPRGPLPLLRRGVWDARVDAAIEEVNGFIRSQNRPGVKILDADPLLLGSDGLSLAAYRADFLHFNAIGYLTLTSELLQLVRS